MNIYVGNLSRDVNEDDLKGAFQAFGRVESVRVIREPAQNISKGFGFVDMPVQAEAEAAITGLHAKELKGNALKVNEARPRRDGWNG